MKITVRVAVDTGDTTEPADIEVLAIAREDLALDTVGLHLAEARELLGRRPGRPGHGPGQARPLTSTDAAQTAAGPSGTRTPRRSTSPRSSAP